MKAVPRPTYTPKPKPAPAAAEPEEQTEPQPKADKDAEGRPIYSREEVARHKAPKDRVWVTYKDGVYDITEASTAWRTTYSTGWVAPC
ncbi:hypothetical protein GPECTOR_37g227 [Gonium pectorale]|uniref:Cytochrome b5 heme-binding domain-containing protein n=1 Tax=Gonium pectorale TaxID=33097 RepID=A0A150GBJ6_GONPE|nr:hypothetical protein GPECTOR_37g227 [Gonium pectorale]|eukprot:KXZ47221.1 hypothetical protein GPECTOR_37g227 [Gonium pectorale]